MPFIVLIFKTRCWYNLRSGVLGVCITGQSFYLRRSPTFSVPKKKHLMTGYCWCSNLARTKNIKYNSDRVYFLSFFVVVVLFGFLRKPPSPPPASFLYNFKTAHDSRPPKLAITLIRTVSDKN